MSFRFLHSSDLHLGKRFGRFDEEVRADLQQARQGILARLGDLAQEQAAGHILLAGDLFDTETPSARLIRQALAEMAQQPQLTWWIIPGNHDSGAAVTLWQQMLDHAPANVRVLMQPAPVDMAPGVVLLPAPCLHRFSGQDLTAWMDGCTTPTGSLRIGLAHGGVIDFGSDAGDGETIAASRVDSARLDYLALGDWHGVFSLNPRCRYSGSPERDRFKHAGRGQCLLVDIAAAGQPPQVTELEVGQYDWREIDLTLSPEMDAAAALEELLPADASARRRMLLRLRVSGWTTLPGRQALLARAGQLAPEFCHLTVVVDDLRSEHSAADLDQISTGGALRAAAEDLRAAAEDSSLSQSDRDIAAAALNRLYGMVCGGAA